MNSLLFHRLIESLGWSLLHFLWQGAAAAALLWMFCCMTRRSAPLVRYVAAGVTLVFMIGCASVTMAWQWAKSQPPALTAVASPAPAPVISPASLPVLESRPLPQETSAIATPVVRETPTAAASPVPAKRFDAGVIMARLRPALPWLVAAWALGVALFSLRMVRGWSVVRKWLRSGTEPDAPGWRERFARLCEMLRVTRPVRLLSSAAVAVPMVAGWLKPVVLVPAGLFIGLTAAQLEAILAHELAHVRRHDYLINLLQNAVETLFFYHPAVWWVSAQLRKERENCCDDLAVAACGGALPYAKALTLLEELRATPSAFALSASGGSLLQRIRRLPGVGNEGTAPAGWPIGLLALAAIAVTLPLTLLRAAAEPAFSAPQAAHIGNGKHSAYCVHDGKETQFVLISGRPFTSETRSGASPQLRTWHDDGTLKLSSGRALDFSRKSEQPDKLTLTWAAAEGQTDSASPTAYDLTKGRVFLIAENGAVKQIPHKTPPVVTQEGLEALYDEVVPDFTAAAAGITATNKSGKWDLGAGVTLEIKQEIHHGADVTTSAILRWPATSDRPALIHGISVAQDVFAAREPWAVAWEKERHTLWIATGELRSWNDPNRDKKAKASRLRVIDFSDPGNITDLQLRGAPENDSTSRPLVEAIRGLIEIPPGGREEIRYVQWAVQDTPDANPFASLIIIARKDGAYDVGETRCEAADLAGTIKKAAAGKTNISVLVGGISEVPYAAVTTAVAACREAGIGFPFAAKSADSATPSKLPNTGVQPSQAAGDDSDIVWSQPDSKGMSLGFTMPSQRTEWKIGDQIKFDIWVRNDSKGTVNLSYSTRMDDGLEMWLTDAGGKKHPADVVLYDGLLIPSQARLEPGQRLKLKIAAFSIQHPNDDGTAPQRKDEDKWVARFVVKAGSYTFGIGCRIPSVESYDGNGAGKQSGALRSKPLSIAVTDSHADDSRTTQPAPGNAVPSPASPKQEKDTDRVSLWEARPGKPEALTAPARVPESLDDLRWNASGKITYFPRHEQTAGLLKLWHEEYGYGPGVPVEAMRRLAAQVKDYIVRYPGEPAEKMKQMLPELEKDRPWLWERAQETIDALCDAATAPAGWLELNEQFRAFERVKPGDVLNAEKLAALPFGPAAPNGLRAAWIFDPMKVSYSVGEVLKSRIIFQNNGKETVEFRTDQWHQEDTWHVVNAAGEKVGVKTTWYTGLTPYQRFRLEPGQACEVAGHGVGIGTADYAEKFSTGAIGAEIQAKPGDELRCTWDVRLDPGWGQKARPLPGADDLPNSLTTGEVKFKVTAADPNAAPKIGVARSTGKFELAPGIKLQVTQTTSSKDGEPTQRINTATIEWYAGNGQMGISWPVKLTPGVAIDTIIWKRGGTALWIVQEKAVRKIDFTNAADVKEQNWKWEEPANFGGAPLEVRAEILKMSPKTAQTPPPAPVLEFRLVAEKAGPDTEPLETVQKGNDPSAILHVNKAPILTTANVKSAAAEKDKSSGQWQINVVLTGEGSAILAKATKENIGKQLAIVGNGKVISAPTIRSEIAGQVMISGNFSEAQAKELAATIQKGAAKPVGVFNGVNYGTSNPLFGPYSSGAPESTQMASSVSWAGSLTSKYPAPFFSGAGAATFFGEHNPPVPNADQDAKVKTAIETALAFFKASTAEEKMKYHLLTDESRKLLTAYYQRHAARAISDGTLILSDAPSRGRIPLLFDFPSLGRHHSIKAFEKDGKMLLEWETCSIYQEESFKDIQADMPKTPVRILASVVPDNYYNSSFQDAARYQCYRLSWFSVDISFFGYANRSSDAFAALEKLALFKGKQVYMEIKYPADAKYKNQVEIVRVLESPDVSFHGRRLKLLSLTVPGTADGKSPEEQLALANELRQKLVNGTDFATLARTHSADSKKENGGDWGWVEENDITPAFWEIVSKLTDGQLSDVIPMAGSYYVFRVESSQPATASNDGPSNQADEISRMLRKGTDFYNLKQYAQAKAEYEKALTMDPDNTAVQRLLEKARSKILGPGDPLAVPAEPAKAGDAGKSAAIELVPDGSFIFDGAPCDEQTFKAKLAEIAKEGLDRSIVISAGKDVEFKWVQRVLEMAHESGLKRISFSSVESADAQKKEWVSKVLRNKEEARRLLEAGRSKAETEPREARKALEQIPGHLGKPGETAFLPEDVLLLVHGNFELGGLDARDADSLRVLTSEDRQAVARLLDSAFAKYTDGMKLLLDYEMQHKHSIPCRSLMAQGYGALGRILARQKKIKDASVAFGESLKLYTDLQKEQPDDPAHAAHLTEIQYEAAKLVAADQPKKPAGAETSDAFAVPADPAKLADARKAGIVVSVFGTIGKNPISAFRIIAGVRGGKDVVNWQPHTLRVGNNGGLIWPLDKAYDEMALRVEADGYAPQVFSWIEKKKGAQDLYFQMVEDKGTSARVLTPDGKPAAGALVALAMVQRDAVLENGKLRHVDEPLPEKPADRWRWPVFVKADADGRFQVPAENDPTAAVLIVHESGVREMALADFKKAPEVTLQQWGRIEGKVQWGDKAGGDQNVSLIIHRDSYGYPGVIAQYGKTKSAADGSFLFDRVLPGLVQLSCPLSGDPNSKPGITEINLTGRIAHVTVNAGVNTAVIGGAGRTVSGKLTGRKSWDGVTIHFHPTAPHVGFPGDEEIWKAWGEFKKSPAGAAFFRDGLKVNADGTFSIPGVLPGDYQIFFSHKGEDGYIGSGKFNVETEAAAQEPKALDIGEFNVKPAPGVVSVPILDDIPFIKDVFKIETPEAAKPEAPKPERPPNEKRSADVPLEQTQFFGRERSAIGLYVNGEPAIVLYHRGFLQSGLNLHYLSPAGSTWRYDGHINIVKDGKELRRFALKLDAKEPDKLYLDGKPYSLLQSVTTPWAIGPGKNGGFSTPHRLIVLQEDREPLLLDRTLPLRSEADLKVIAQQADREAELAWIYRHNRAVAALDGWVLAWDVRHPHSHSDGALETKLRVFPDGRVVVPDRQKGVRETRISQAELTELLSWLEDEQKVWPAKTDGDTTDVQVSVPNRMNAWDAFTDILILRKDGKQLGAAFSTGPKNPDTGAFDAIRDRLNRLVNPR